MTISTETIDNSYLLFIRSREVKQNTPNLNSDMTIDLEAKIGRTRVSQDIHVQLSSCEIPYSFYNITEALQNNNLYINGSLVLTLTSQHYDVYTLIDFINDANINLTATFNENTSKISLKNVDTSNLTINFSSSGGLAKVLGFTQNDIILTPNETIQGNNVINLNTIHSIFVHTSLPVNNVITTTQGNYKNIIQKIPVKTSYGNIIHYNPYENSVFSTIINQNSINNFSIELRDQNDNLIDFNGANFELSLLFEVHNQENNEIPEPQPIQRRSEPIIPQPVPQPIRETIPPQVIQQRTEVPKPIIPKPIIPKPIIKSEPIIPKPIIKSEPIDIPSQNVNKLDEQLNDALLMATLLDF